MTAVEPFVRIEGLAKTYLMADRRLEVLRGIDLEIRAGEIVALTGPSGAGKSTFLHLLGTLLLSFLATIYPATKAARLRPVDGLRAE